jgi:NADH-quinone oxidoreductase subunit L
MGFVVAGLTAFYMFRLYHMTFSGAFRGTEDQAHHLHESPRTMILPLQVLAVGSVVAGYLGLPALLGEPVGFPNVFERFLEPVFESAHETLPEVFRAGAPGHGIEAALMGASVLMAALGIGLAWQFFQRHPEYPQRLATSLRPVHQLLLRKYYVDEIYDAVFVRGLALGGGNALHTMDRYVVDGGDGEVRPGLGVNGVAWLVRDGVARTSDFFDRWGVDGLVNAIGAVLDNASYLMRALQNGLVQHYALSSLIGVFLMIWAGKFVLHLF